MLSKKEKKELLQKIFEEDFKRFKIKFPNIQVHRVVAERFFWRGIQTKRVIEEVEADEKN